MATSNMKAFSDDFIKSAQLEEERSIYLMNNKDAFVCDWINELKERIIELECSNQNLHRICGTTAFNPTQEK